MVNVVLGIFLIFFVQNGLELKGLLALSENDVAATDLNDIPMPRLKVVTEQQI